MAANRPTQNTVLSTGSVASEVSMLFRTMRVSEIRGIESKIRHEAEDKSDSLRELLGTRYKDLLRAADEITTIRDASSTNVRDALRNMAKSATQLREHFAEKSGQDPDSPAPVTDDLARRKKVHVIGSKLKHIVDSPEVLYAHLEAGHVYEAAVRYFLASRNYHELKNTQGVEGVANRFAERRWDQVQVFKNQVLAAAEKKLITPGSDPVLYSKVLAALFIMSGKDRDVMTTVQGMLASRISWIEDANRGSSKAVPERMRRLAAIVSDSISCMSKTFWNTESGVEPLLRDVDVAAADEVKLFRESNALKNACASWIADVKGWVGEHSKDILASADTSRILADTLRGIDEVFQAESWANDCQAALGQPPKFVLNIFTPVISERAAAVASESVQRSVESVLSNIEGVWGDISVGSHRGKLLWSAISSQALKWNIDSLEGSEFGSETGRSGGEADDIVRDLVCDGPVSKVIDVFESSLSGSLRDVTILTQRVPSVSQAFDASVRDFLPRVLDGLQSHLDSIPLTFSDDPTSSEPSCEHVMEKALFISRIAAALGSAELVRSVYNFCGSVTEGHSQNASTASTSHDVASSKKSLQNFVHKAFDICEKGYRTWANRLCSRLRDQLYSELVSEGAILVKIGWASTAGSESESEKMKPDSFSDMQYPTSASTAATKFVLRACSYANRAGGFALPESAISFLREEMSRAAEHAYREAFVFYFPKHGGNTDSLSLRESEQPEVAVMQMLFDVLVLKRLLPETPKERGARNSKEGLKAIEQQLHAAIDPINFASCKKALHGSVDGYCGRTSVMFGTITRRGVSNSSPPKRPLVSSSQLASSNLVSLSRTVPRFTYLPAPMPSTYTTAGVGTAGLSAKAALGALRSEAAAANGSSFGRREVESSVAEYASKVSESVGRLGRGFFESWTRKAG